MCDAVQQIYLPRPLLRTTDGAPNPLGFIFGIFGVTLGFFAIFPKFIAGFLGSTLSSDIYFILTESKYSRRLPYKLIIIAILLSYNLTYGAIFSANLVLFTLR